MGLPNYTRVVLVGEGDGDVGGQISYIVMKAVVLDCSIFKIATTCKNLANRRIIIVTLRAKHAEIEQDQHFKIKMVKIFKSP